MHVSPSHTLPSGAPPADASVRADDLRAFRGIIGSSFGPLRISSAGPGPFAARVQRASADGIAFTEVSARPHLVERTPETIAQGGGGYYKLSLILSGGCVLAQDGRELTMRAGDLTVYDTSRPYSLLFAEEFRNLIVMFPRERLELPTRCADQLSAVSLGRQHAGLSPVLSSFLTQFPAGLGPLNGHVRAKLARTSLDLIRMMFAGILDVEAERRDPRRALLRQAREYIDAHLGSPALTPGSIAASQFISARHLHALFHEEGTTVSTWIRERRLERCRIDLEDPTLAGRTILSVAARWGFTDAAHFSRVFKAAYGVSPRDLRRGSA